MEHQEIGNTDHRKNKVLTKLDLSSIFENTRDSVWAINTSYEIQYANTVFVAAFYESFGVSLKADSNLLLSLPKSLREDWKKRYDRVLSNESFSFVENVTTKNSALYVEVFMNPIVVNNKVIGALFIGKDITNRRRTEKALRDSQLLLKASLESQKDTILFSINKDYDYLYFNTSHFNVMKHAYGKEIKLGMNILHCITSVEDRKIAKHNYDRALKGETHSNVRAFGDKNLAYYESFFNPIINEQNKIIGATGLARDITERKKAEIDLLERTEELRELNVTKDKLFSIIAHDLRSPFHNILGFTKLLINKVHDEAFTQHEKYLNIIHTAANSTLDLLDNLLNWAKSQTGRTIFNPQKINFSQCILEVFKLEKLIAQAKNITLTYLTPDKIEVYADENMLKIILRNLISNAIKFTNDGGQVSVFAIVTKNSVEITISDTGIGMSEEKQKQLFKLSSDKTSIGTANEKGSGLGLMLCKDFVEKHGGKIWIKSKEGEGSDFKFTLPLYTPA